MNDNSIIQEQEQQTAAAVTQESSGQEQQQRSYKQRTLNEIEDAILKAQAEVAQLQAEKAKLSAKPIVDRLCQELLLNNSALNSLSSLTTAEQEKLYKKFGDIVKAAADEIAKKRLLDNARRRKK